MRSAGIEGPHACPRGLRHSFDVAAVTAGVPLALRHHGPGPSGTSSHSRDDDDPHPGRGQRTSGLD